MQVNITYSNSKTYRLQRFDQNLPDLIFVYKYQSPSNSPGINSIELFIRRYIILAQLKSVYLWVTNITSFKVYLYYEIKFGTIFSTQYSPCRVCCIPKIIRACALAVLAVL